MQADLIGEPNTDPYPKTAGIQGYSLGALWVPPLQQTCGCNVDDRIVLGTHPEE